MVVESLGGVMGVTLLGPGNGLSAAAADLLLLSTLFFNQLIGDIVFVDVGHVGHGFLADPSSGDDLDIIKPDISVNPRTAASFLSF